MLSNVGTTDRIIRIIIGVAGLVVGWYFHSYWGLAALLPLLTGLFKWCGLYSLLGVSTCRLKRK